jgi:hypothetical protein
MSEKSETEKIRELAAEKLVDFMKFIQIAQLRLRCAEIVWTTGSQEHRKKIEVEAERLYNFAIPRPSKENLP